MDRFERGAAAFAELCRVMAKLRAPDGCPWDREQTLESLRPYLLEEAYEVLEVMSSEDAGLHAEALGDLLFQLHLSLPEPCKIHGTRGLKSALRGGSSRRRCSLSACR